MSDSKRVLIIDDEQAFARFVEKVASGLGYDAIVTSTADAFRSAYRAVPPDVIVLDIVMPDEDGIELIDWLVGQGCRAHILIISGYGATFADAAQTIAETKGKLRVTQLQKPITLAELRAQLEAAAA
jgi:two-component system KDP operon response regulator KdpE